MTKHLWRKLGHIFSPSGARVWMKTHAQVPFTLVLQDRVRVFFSTREAADQDKRFRSFSGYVDLAKDDLTKIVDVSREPILPLGNLGEFDEYGSMAGSIVKDGSRYILYYCGWQRMTSVPYNWAIGCAISEDGKSFRRFSSGPIVGATAQEPYLQACPIVYRLTETRWEMYYLSGVRWIKDGSKAESQYVLKRARSNDGFNWERDAKEVLPRRVEDECQTSASIFFKDGLHHMYFSYRYGTDFRENSDRGYRIGYAYSEDNMRTWIRDDARAVIDVGKDGWDNEMIGYPHIFGLNGRYFMLYCGNHFGRDGFGYAVLED